MGPGEPVEHGVVLCKMSAQRVQRLAHDIVRELFVQLADFFLAFQIPARQFLENMLQRVLDLAHELVETPALLLGQGGKFLAVHDLAVLDRRHSDLAVPVFHEAEAALLRAPGDGLECFLLVLVVPRFHHLAAALVVLAHENVGQRSAQSLDDRPHAVPQASAAARCEPQGNRPLGVVKVIDIDPVGRRGLPFCQLLQIAAHGLLHTGAARTQNEQVVTVMGHAHAHFDGAQGPFLSVHAVRRRVELRQGVAGLEPQSRGVAEPVERLHRQRRNRLPLL